MVKKNFEYLKVTLNRLGFSEELNSDLEKYLRSAVRSFSLQTTHHHHIGSTTSDIHYTLQFAKSKISPLYFFNSYRATLKSHPLNAERSSTFYITKDQGLTATEAFNLLSGRSLKKDINVGAERYTGCWIELDLTKKNAHDDYQVKIYTDKYDLSSELNKYGFTTEPKSGVGQFVTELEKGNLCPVTVNINGKHIQLLVCANPRERTVNFFDSELRIRQISTEKISTSAKRKNKGLGK
jgi:hypothetical protein